MINWISYSQNTERTKVNNIPTRIVKVSTLKAMGKDLEKCDSLKVAYESKSVQLDNLITANLSMFKELENERNKRLQREKELARTNELIIKQSKKQNNNLIFGIGGISLGIILGVLIN